MRKFTFKGALLAIVLMLFGCLAIQAADGDLITKQVIIKLDEAGTLPDKIGSSKKYKLMNLKIVGEINGTDLRFIRDMAGRDYYSTKTDGKLSVLDLCEAKIVSGGDDYYHVGNYKFFTSNDEIGEYAFCDCNGLTNLALPSGVTSIDRCAFYDCSGLTNLTLPSSLTKIGDYAFWGCGGLTSLTLPLSLTKIGGHAFYNCSGLKSLVLPSNLTWIKESTFEGCSGLTSLTLPSSLTVIFPYAFEGCSGLTSLVLPSSLTEIDSFAFYDCSGLTSLTLPTSLTYIRDCAYSRCSGLTSIYVYADKMPELGTNIFEGCNAKKCKVYVPKGTYDEYRLSEFGYFENIEEFDATAIDKVTTSSDAKDVSHYSVNGQRLSAPTKGLNIVKYSDGSVKKVAVQ